MPLSSHQETVNAPLRSGVPPSGGKWHSVPRRSLGRSSDTRSEVLFRIGLARSLLVYDFRVLTLEEIGTDTS
jgi:hypothetical protein